MTMFQRPSLALISVLAVAACRQDAGTLADASDHAPDTAVDAATPATPACQTPPSPLFDNKAAGPVLSNEQVWTVVWQGDEALGAQVDHFHDVFLTSQLRLDQLGQYGIDRGSAMGVVVLGAPPAEFNTDAQINAAVADVIGATTTSGGVVPSPGPNTVFDFIVPKGTKDPGGYYHDATTRTFAAQDGTQTAVAYAVIPQDHVSFVSDVDYLTWSDTHELDEAATDPSVDGLSWYAPDVGPDDGEVADLCNDIPVHVTLSDGNAYALTRTYSATKAAAGGVDPCVPALAAAAQYENIAIEPTSIAIPAGLGETATISLVPFTCGPTDQMGWALYGDPSYSITPSEGTTPPSGQVTVTITRVATSPAGITSLNVWVTPPDDTNALIPQQESFAGIEH